MKSENTWRVPSNSSKISSKAKKWENQREIAIGLYLQGAQICSRTATPDVSASKHPTLISFGWNVDDPKVLEQHATSSLAA
jgi:hypothetical protein